MKLTSLIGVERIFIGEGGTDRRQVYGGILDKLSAAVGGHHDRGDLLDRMIAREDTTRLPYEAGLAIPHARGAEFADLHFAIATLRQPVLLKPYDLAPSRVVLMSLIPPSASDLYLKVLAALAKYAIAPGNIDKLAAADSAERLVQVFTEADVRIKSTLTAEDIMDTTVPTVAPGDGLAKAIDLMTRAGIERLPVVDAGGILVGMLSGAQILKRAIPEYLMLMENINFLTSFEPFERLLKEEESIRVGEVMEDAKPLAISPKTPIIQLTMRLVRREAEVFLVADEAGRFKGTAGINEIIRKVLRG